MALISISKLSFAYDGSYDNIFENVTFQLDTDWKTGLVGRNGRGKTTLLKLLLGEEDDGGAIQNRVTMQYFPYLIEDENELVINIAQAINSDLLEWQLLLELSLLEVSKDVLYAPFCTLSQGERTKVMLAILFSKDNAFLLIDEPTNHLDANARDVLAAYLKKKQGFILVSHDRTFLDNTVDHILSINKTGVVVERGNFSSYLANKEQRDNYEKMQNEKLNSQIAHLESASKRTAKWSANVEKTKYATRNSGIRPDRGFVGHKAAKMMKRSKSVEKRKEKAIVEKSALLKDIELAGNLKLHKIQHHAKKLVEISDLSVFYGDKCVLNKFNFEISQGERIALTGKNGCGKSTVLKAILNESKQKATDAQFVLNGKITLASNLVLSYVSQDTSFLRGTLGDFINLRGIDHTLFKSILRNLDFSRTQFEKNIENYSEGQKKKVLLAASLCDRAHLFVWDEPLNYVDVLSRIQLEELICQYNPTMLFVEHDRAFVNKVATKVIEM